MSYRRAVPTALWPALAVAVTGLALAQPAQVPQGIAFRYIANPNHTDGNDPGDQQLGP